MAIKTNVVVHGISNFNTQKRYTLKESSYKRTSTAKRQYFWSAKISQGQEQKGNKIRLF